MTAVADPTVLAPTPTRPRVRRLIGAEVLKLRRRRGMLIAATLLVIVPVVAAYAVLAALHGADPAKYGPAGGGDNLAATIELTSQVGGVAAVLIGVTAGGGDVAAGVFRELVMTGRSRTLLFAVRVAGGLAVLAPLMAAALAVAATASVVLAGGLATPPAAD